ncbi:hypothetical protein IJG92_03390 [Candidatus Saccharibacteria bacterium]|nr:hypothetical protein [Candidatus Saccharibacteria bacterium]MBQ6149642.1 hypothetical protein [Candidatus Saccharibacteria bacterium]
MSKKSPMLDPERIEEVLAEFVDMYIEKGGGFPTARDIKKNPYITEEEVAILRKNHQLDERIIRTMAEQKTGRKYKLQRELNKEHAKAAVAKRAEDNMDKIARGIVAAAKRAEEKKDLKQEVKKVNKPRTDSEKLKGVLREFAIKNLRWPTDKEIQEFYKEGVSVWPSCQTVYNLIGSNRGEWEKQIFPEGLPDGFIPSNKGGLTKKASPAPTPTPVPIKAPIEARAEETVTMDEIKKRLEKIHKMLVERELLELITMSTNFQMESRSYCDDFYGKKITLTFKVE